MKHVVAQARPKRAFNLAAAASTGVLAALTVLGVGHLIAAFIDPAASPFYAMGAAVVDHTPHELKDAAIRRFGSNDKLALFVSMGAVMVVFAAILGILERRRPVGSALLVLLGGVVVEAALQRPTATTWFAVPGIVGVVAGVVVMRVLIRQIGIDDHRLSAESATIVESTSDDPRQEVGGASPVPHTNDRDDPRAGGVEPDTGRHTAGSGAGHHTAQPAGSEHLSEADDDRRLSTGQHSAPVSADHAVRRNSDPGGTRWWRTRLRPNTATNDPQMRALEPKHRPEPEGKPQSATDAASGSAGQAASAEAERSVAGAEGGSGGGTEGDTGRLARGVVGANADTETSAGGAGVSGYADAGAGAAASSGGAGGAAVSGDVEAGAGGAGVSGGAESGDGRVAGVGGGAETAAGVRGGAEFGDGRLTGGVAGMSGDVEAGGSGANARDDDAADSGRAAEANGGGAVDDECVAVANEGGGAGDGRGAGGSGGGERNTGSGAGRVAGVGRGPGVVPGAAIGSDGVDHSRNPNSGGERLSGAGASRRRFLAMAAGVGALAAGAAVAGKWIGARLHDVVADRAGFVVPRAAVPAREAGPGVRQSVPGLSEFVTPNDRFYRVDTALQLPALTSGDWRIRIHGMVDRPIELDFDQLRRRTPVERMITMTCVSNEVGGDLAGTAVWTGYPLADLLAEAGVRPEADMLLSRSVDGFTAGTPVSAVTDGRDALLAIGMNGEPLPIAHGYPARLIVPGLYGYVSATKWVVDLELTRFDRAKAYWTERGWGAQAPIKTASRIDVPAAFATIPAGEVTVAGVAWAQHRGIDAVEVQVDNQPWQPATLADEYSTDTWRQWTWRWTATPGPHTLRVRATDRTGTPQPDTRTPPFPDGSTGWHSRVITVS